jgi:hypothetical protein
MVEASTLMGAAGANMSPHVDGGRMNEAEVRPEDEPGRAALTPRTSKGPSFSPSQEATLDDVTFVPRSFDIVDLRNGESGLLRYPQVPLLHASWGWWQGCRVDMFTGHDCVPTTKGDADYGWSGCSTIGPSQSGRSCFTRFLPVIPLLPDALLF